MRRKGRPFRRSFLAANAESTDQLGVTGFVLLLEIIKKRTAARHHLQKTTTGVVVLLVGLEVVGKGVDPLGQDRDLDFRRTGVALDGCVFLDKLSLALSR